MTMQDRAYAVAIFIILGICCIGAYVAVSGFLNANPDGFSLALNDASATPTMRHGRDSDRNARAADEYAAAADGNADWVSTDGDSRSDSRAHARFYSNDCDAGIYGDAGSVRHAARLRF